MVGSLVVGLSPIVTRRAWDYRWNALRVWGGGVFPMIIIRMYASFGENHGKSRTPWPTSTSENRTKHLPFTSFQGRTARQLSGRINGYKVTSFCSQILPII